jgi:hypothetical protein
MAYHSHRIVVLGAGYAGMLATARLAGKLKRDMVRGNVAITLVNAADVFVERLRLHHLAANQPIIQRPIAEILRGTGVAFMRGAVTGIDVVQRTIDVQTDAGAVSLGYDYLVCALGSTIDRDSVAGVREHAYVLTPSGPNSAVALREVFDYAYAEIATILEKDEAACRQLFSRAKKHIAARRPRFKATMEQHRQLLSRFMQAVGTGQLDGLMQVLSEDVTMWTDGGGKARGAATRPLHGRRAVAQFVLASTRYLPANYDVEIAVVNGRPAAIVRAGQQVLLMIAVEVDSRNRATDYRMAARRGVCARWSSIG